MNLNFSANGQQWASDAQTFLYYGNFPHSIFDFYLLIGVTESLSTLRSCPNSAPNYGNIEISHSSFPVNFYFLTSYVAVFGDSFINSAFAKCGLFLGDKLNALTSAFVVSDKLVSCSIFSFVPNQLALNLQIYVGYIRLR